MLSKLDLTEKPREDWDKYFKKNFGLIIDLGCGDGDDSYFLAKKGYKVIAVDENNDNLKFNHPNLTFIKQKLEIPIDNQFDGVIANFSLHLLFPEARLKIIDHYLKRLNPGGIFYILIFKKFVTLPFLNLFPDEPLIEYFLKEEDHVPDGKHTHEIAKIIYKKP